MIDIEYCVAVEVVALDDVCVVVLVVPEEVVVLDVVCVVVLVVVEEVVVLDVVCVVVFKDEEVVTPEAVVVLEVVCVVLLPDEQLNASTLTSMARMKINGKKRWVDNLVTKNGGFVFSLLSNGRYRRFPLCPRDFLGNPSAVTPYSGIQVFSSKSRLIFTIQHIITFVIYRSK